MTAPGPSAEAAPLAVVAGGGAFPLRVAEAARRAGRAVFVLALAGEAGPEIECFPHVRIALGEVGRFFAELESRGIRDIVLVGAVTRPEIGRLRFDLGALKSLPEIVRLVRGGDDNLLSGVVRFVEARGYRVLGAHEVAPDLTAPAGPMSRAEPSRAERADIDAGFAALDHLSPLDIGQCLAIADGRILAVEAAEGTDGLLARLAALRASGRLKLPRRAGVLVKAPKRGQDLRVDMPAFGEATVRGAASAGLAGIALEAGRVLVRDEEAVRREADAAGLFVIGVAQ